MSQKSTFEKQYNSAFELRDQIGSVNLGVMASQTWVEDPSRMTFMLSRYKFVSRMLDGFDRVLEIGCGDGFGSRIVAQRVSQLTLSDVDPLLLENAKQHWVSANLRTKVQFVVLDLLKKQFDERFDGIYFLDVLEHIDKNDEDLFMSNVLELCEDNATCIIGIPSKESQVYASPRSKAGHINCKSGDELKLFLSKFFRNVYLFSMNDELVHTGFSGMAHYLFALCNEKV